MNEILQWVAILVVFFIACIARGSAVNYTNWAIRKFDEELGQVFSESADKIRKVDENG